MNTNVAFIVFDPVAQTSLNPQIDIEFCIA